MLKRNRIILLILLFVIAGGLFFGFKWNEQNSIIDENTEKMLNYLEMDNCSLKKLGSYLSISYSAIQFNVSDDEVQKYINTELDKYATKVVVDDRNTVEHGDLIVVDYEITYDGEVLKKVEGDIVNVGSGKYDSQFETYIVGAKVGENYQMEWLVPDNSSIYGEYENLVGKRVKLNVIVQYIYYLEYCELTDDFVQKEFGIDSVNAYYDSIRTLLMGQAEEYAKMQEEYAILKAVINNSDFNLNDDVIVDNAVDVYYDYEDEARLYDMDLSEYSKKILGVQGDQIYDNSYDDSKLQIETYLTIGGIAKAAGLTVSENELEELCASHDYEIEELDEKTICYMTYSLLQNKVLNYLHENAVCA